MLKIEVLDRTVSRDDLPELSSAPASLADLEIRLQRDPECLRAALIETAGPLQSGCRKL